MTKAETWQLKQQSEGAASVSSYDGGASICAVFSCHRMERKSIGFHFWLDMFQIKRWHPGVNLKVLGDNRWIKKNACALWLWECEENSLKLSCWVLALSDIHVWVSPSAFPSHIYYFGRPSCWAKQPHNQTQITGAKGAWVGALVIYKHMGTHKTCMQTHTRAIPTWPYFIHILYTDTYTPPSSGNQYSSHMAKTECSISVCWVI